MAYVKQVPGTCFIHPPRRNLPQNEMSMRMSVHAGWADKKGQDMRPDLDFVVEMMGFEPTTPTLRT